MYTESLLPPPYVTKHSIIELGAQPETDLDPTALYSLNTSTKNRSI